MSLFGQVREKFGFNTSITQMLPIPGGLVGTPPTTRKGKSLLMKQ